MIFGATFCVKCRTDPSVYVLVIVCMLRSLIAIIAALILSIRALALHRQARWAKAALLGHLRATHCLGALIGIAILLG